jgi:hypothetical protein
VSAFGWIGVVLGWWVLTPAWVLPLGRFLGAVERDGERLAAEHEAGSVEPVAVDRGVVR